MKVYFCLLDQNGVKGGMSYTGALVQPYTDKANHEHMGLCVFSVKPTLQLLDIDLREKLRSYLASVNCTIKDCAIVRNYSLEVH